MNFTLCYKQYDYEITFNACREFKRETGKCLLDFLCVAYSAYHHASQAGGSLMDRAIAMYKDCPSDDAAFALYVMAKEKASSLTYDEIWDGVMKTRFAESGDGKNEPVQVITAMIGADFINERQGIDGEEKKDSAQL